MRSTKFTLLLILLIVPPATAVDFSGNELFIPIVSRVPGALGTQWRTDVMISSRHDLLSTTVSIIYDAVGRTPIQMTRELAPRQTVTLTDIVRQEFGHQESYGTLYLRSSMTNVRIAAHARIYNVGNPGGEFGQVVMALPIAQLGRVIWLNGLIGVRGHRTNVGVANPNNDPAHFSISWFDKNGELRGGAMFFEVEPAGVMLFNDIFDKTGVEYDEGLTLRLRSDVPIYAYASVVRNDTGDAYTIIGDGRDDD